MKLKSRQWLGIFFLVFGGIIFFSPFIYKKHLSLKTKKGAKKERLVFPIVSSSAELIKTGPVTIDKRFLTTKFSLTDLPKRIIIPSRSIDVFVKPARIVEGRWELFHNSASFGLGSATPGRPGNIVIFAHAKWGLFKPLKRVKKGAAVYILTSSRWYSYKVVEIKTVLPSQTEVIKPTKEETLTLFTCTGFADAKRLIVVAKRVK